MECRGSYVVENIYVCIYVCRLGGFRDGIEDRIGDL